MYSQIETRTSAGASARTYTYTHTQTHIHIIYQLFSIILSVGILIYIIKSYKCPFKTIAPNILLNHKKYQSKNKTKHTLYIFMILDF